MFSGRDAKGYTRLGRRECLFGDIGISGYRDIATVYRPARTYVRAAGGRAVRPTEGSALPGEAWRCMEAQAA